MIKRILTIGLLIYGAHLTEDFCHQKTRGFSVAKIRASEKSPISCSLPEVLKQKFSYFADGKQAFVFLSEDKRYVLKFFKRASGFPPAWTAQIPLLNRFKAFRPEKIAQNAWKRSRDYAGYLVAFDRCPEETGLIFIHLQVSKKPLVVPLIDPIGIEHQVDLSQTHFVLQKRAEPVVDVLERLVEAGASDELHQLISELLGFCKKLSQSGIYDDDPSFHKNFGFIEGKLVQIDPGQYQELPNIDETQQLLRVKRRFKKWLKYYYPELIVYVDETA